MNRFLATFFGKMDDASRTLSWNYYGSNYDEAELLRMLHLMRLHAGTLSTLRMT